MIRGASGGGVSAKIGSGGGLVRRGVRRGGELVVRHGVVQLGNGPRKGVVRPPGLSVIFSFGF